MSSARDPGCCTCLGHFAPIQLGSAYSRTRNSGATHLLEAGVDLYSLSQWLGHRHVSTTMRYLHLARPDAPDGAKAEPLALLGALPAVANH
jgi:integrase